NLTANGTQGIGGSNGETYGQGGLIQLQGSGGSITANSLIASANGSTFGGNLGFNTVLGSDLQPGGIQIGSINAIANGGDFGGTVFVDAQSGTIDLGNAVLGASGASGGS